MFRRFAVTMLLGALVACSDPSGLDVAMTDAQSFDPQETTVKVGDTVTWVNESSQSHTVTAYQDEIPDTAKYFASGATSEQDARDGLENQLIAPDELFEWTFDEAGTYRYFCIPHEGQGMVGTIVVEG